VARNSAIPSLHFASVNQVFMVFEFLRLSIDITDVDFNEIYPQNIRALSSKHWSPVGVAKAASEFLIDRPGARVLDVGSGVGKFCMVGATHTKGHFTGVEQRLRLVELSEKISSMHRLCRVKYLHANITDIDFRDYTAFYFYNSFYENTQPAHKIDDAVRLDVKLYDTYSMYMVGQLSNLPSGTRFAAYCTPAAVIPRSFRLVDSLYGGSLNFWEKVV
jgi:SAM-dependent methyltransferase